MEEVGKIISRERRGAGLTQELLAAKTGMTVSAISKAERGETTPHPSNLKAIASALKISPRVLLLAAGVTDAEEGDTVTITVSRETGSEFFRLARLIDHSDDETLGLLMRVAADAITQHLRGEGETGARLPTAVIPPSGDPRFVGGAGRKGPSSAPAEGHTGRGRKS